MGFFSKTEVYICSPMKGMLTYKGEPLKNAKIIRTEWWTTGDGEGAKEEFFTNEKGEFDLPPKIGSARGHQDWTINHRLSAFVGTEEILRYIKN